MKKHRFRNATVMIQKFLSGELRLLIGESVVAEGGDAVRDGRYFVFGDGSRVHCKYVEGDKVAVMMSYKEAGLSAEQFAMSRGWSDRRYANALFMPHHFVVDKVRCLRVRDFSEEDMLRSGVFKNGGGYYMVGGDVGGIEKNAVDVFRRMFDRYSSVPYELNPWVIVYDIIPLI